MKKPKRIHLGAGIYAADAGTHVVLTSKRKNGKGRFPFRVALNADVLDNFLTFLEQACGTTITVEKAEGRSE